MILKFCTGFFEVSDPLGKTGSRDFTQWGKAGSRSVRYSATPVVIIKQNSTTTNQIVQQIKQKQEENKNQNSQLVVTIMKKVSEIDAPSITPNDLHLAWEPQTHSKAAQRMANDNYALVHYMTKK